MQLNADQCNSMRFKAAQCGSKRRVIGANAFNDSHKKGRNIELKFGNSLIVKTSESSQVVSKRLKLTRTMQESCGILATENIVKTNGRAKIRWSPRHSLNVNSVVGRVLERWHQRGSVTYKENQIKSWNSKATNPTQYCISFRTLISECLQSTVEQIIVL